MPGIPPLILALAGISTMFSNLGAHVAYKAVVDTVIDQGAVQLFGLLVLPALLSSYSSGGDFDDPSFPCLPGPTLDEDDDNDLVTEEEMDFISWNDPCRVSFPTTENELSSTPATLGEGCKGAFPRKVDRSGFQVGKALPPATVVSDITGARHFKRAAFLARTLSTSGGARNGMVDVTDAREGKNVQMRIFDDPDDGDPAVEAGISFSKEIIKLDDQGPSPWESPQVPPELLEGGSSVNTTAMFEENTCPVAAYTTGYCTAGDEPASSWNDQAFLQRAGSSALILWVPPVTVAYRTGAFLCAESSALVLWVPPAMVSCRTDDFLPRAGSRAMVVWTAPATVSRQTEAFPRAVPGTMVVWTPPVDLSPRLDSKVATTSWCCYRFSHLASGVRAAERFMGNAILAARQARRIAVELDLSLASTVEGTDETLVIVDTSETLPPEPTVAWLEPELVGIGIARTVQPVISQYVRRGQASFVRPEPEPTVADAAGADVGGIYDGGATAVTSTTTKHPPLGDRVDSSSSKGHRGKEAHASDDMFTMPDLSAVTDALGPWMLDAGRGIATYAWMARYGAPSSKGKTGTAGWTAWWILVCLLGTSSQVLDGLFAEETWLPVLLLGKILAANTWFVIIFMVNLAGSVVLAVANSTVVACSMAWDVGLALVNSTVVAASVFILAAVASIWIVVNDELGLEAKQQIPSTTTMPPAQSTPVPARTASPTPLESAPIRHAAPVTETRAGRKARRKAELMGRQKSQRKLRTTALHCWVPLKGGEGSAAGVVASAGIAAGTAAAAIAGAGVDSGWARRRREGRSRGGGISGAATPQRTQPRPGCLPVPRGIMARLIEGGIAGDDDVAGSGEVCKAAQ